MNLSRASVFSFSVLVFFFAALLPSSAAFAATCTDKIELQRLSQNIWQVPVLSAEQVPEAAGMAFPVGVIALDQTLVLLDAGPSHRFGELLKDALDCEFGKPVQAIIMSHAGPENTLASCVFDEVSLEQIFAGPLTAETMQQNCEQCLDNMRERLGDLAMADTVVRPAKSVLSNDADVQKLLGPNWRVLRYASAFSEEDLVLWNATEPALFLGGLAAEQSLPALQNHSNLIGWRSALQDIKIEIGHAQAPPYMLEQVAQTEAYLATVQEQVCLALQAGLSQYQLMAESATAFQAYTAWQGFAERHTLNMQRAWRSLEDAWIAAKPDPCS